MIMNKLQPFKFKWYIQNDKLLVEKEDIFDISSYQKIYFFNGNIEIGILPNNLFYIDDSVNIKKYDFKLASILIPFQTKTVHFSLKDNLQYIYSYNIGFKNDREKYFFRIMKDNIILEAFKDNQHKIIRGDFL